MHRGKDFTCSHLVSSMKWFFWIGRGNLATISLPHSIRLTRSNPSLTRLARIPAEIGRIEFKACDSCDDFTIYAALLTVLKGLILDTTLPGRATTPDAALHQLSARHGFANNDIAAGAQAVLTATERALHNDEDVRLLAPLQMTFAQGRTAAHNLRHNFQRTGSIEASLLQTYATYSKQGHRGIC